MDITSNDSLTGNSFPPHNVSPEVKSSKRWGLQAGRATYYYGTNSTAPTLFYNDRDSYETFIKYGFGQQSIDIVKPALHINNENQNQSFLGGIRWQNKNFVTKRIQATVSRLFNRKYDPVASALDPTSSNRRESFKASLQVWADHQDWLLERQQMLGVDVQPQGVDMSNLPDNDESLQIFMQDYKLNNEILTELGVLYHMDRLDFDAIKEQFDQYFVMLPVAGVWAGLDSSGMPVLKPLNPSRVVAPHTEYKNYRRMPFCGYVEDFTIAEFRQLAAKDFDKDETQRLIDKYARKGDYHMNRFNTEFPETNRDVDTIQVLHFEVPTNDEYVYLQRKDKYGNDRFVEKPYNYYQGGTNPDGTPKPDMSNFRSKYKTERKIFRVPKKTVYGGYMIVGSDVVFDYGEKNYCKGELGYKLFAPNMMNGRSTCMVKQMIPCVNNLETFDKKIQQLVASDLPRIIKIDLFALRKASFKMGDKTMDTQALINMFFQSGLLITDTSDLNGAQGDSRKPIEVFQNSSLGSVVEYLRLMQAELEQLDEIIGYNKVSSGSTVSGETGKSVAQQQADATDINLDHLYRADKSMVLESFKALAHLHRISVMLNPDYYIPILGEVAVAQILASEPFEDIGLSVEARPTAAEWQEFYLEIGEMVKSGFIQPEDRVALRRFKSLREAGSYLKVLVKKRKAEAQQEKVGLIQENAKAQQQSNDQASQQAQALEAQKLNTIQVQSQLDMQRDQKLHQFKLEEIYAAGQNSAADTAIQGEYQLKAANQRSSNSSQ